MEHRLLPKINRAASGSKAWKTNLAGNYNDLEKSYLYSPCFDISGMTNPTLSFNVAWILKIAVLHYVMQLMWNILLME